MSADYTTVGLIANAKRRGSIPTSSGLTTSDFLEVLTEQLRNYIPAFLKGIREEFIIAQLSIAVTSGTVPIPVRACGVALRTIGWTLSDGTVLPLPRIEPERRGAYQSSGQPCGYMFQGNNCILLPAPTSGTLVVSYQQRPGQLVLPTDCGAFSAYDDATSPIVSNLPAEFVVGSLVDLVSCSPNFELLQMDLEIATITDLGGGQSALNFVGITEQGQLTALLKAGDFICLATETPVPQLPLECFDLLAQAAAVECARATGSTRTTQVQEALKDLRADVASILSPRSDGSARVVVSRSRAGRRWF